MVGNNQLVLLDLGLYLSASIEPRHSVPIRFIVSVPLESS
jgi:hypothetical protein